jgi:hypothetical protein
MAARAAGMSYEDLIGEMVEAARAWAKPARGSPVPLRAAAHVAG